MRRAGEQVGRVVGQPVAGEGEPLQPREVLGAGDRAGERLPGVLGVNRERRQPAEERALQRRRQAVAHVEQVDVPQRRGGEDLVRVPEELAAR